MRPPRSPLLLLPMLTLLGGCAAQAPTGAPSGNGTALYDSAMEAYRGGELAIAVNQLSLLESANGGNSPLDQVRMALARGYRALGRYPECVAAINRYVQQHPRHAAMDQMLMLRGECQLQQAQDGATAAAPVSADASRRAYRDFDYIATRLGNSPLQADAAKRAAALRQQLAAGELASAQQHLRAGDYAAAINRSRYLLENHEQTDAVPGALAVMADAYSGLGLHDRAASTRAVLRGNYPPADAVIPPSRAAAEPPTALPAPTPPTRISPPAAAAPTPERPPTPEPSTTATPGPTTATPEPSATANESTAASTAAPVSTGWVVQVASFKREANARALRNRLRGAGYGAFITHAADYERVLVGYEAEPSAIEALRRRLKRQFGLDGLIRHSDDLP